MISTGDDESSSQKEMDDWDEYADNFGEYYIKDVYDLNFEKNNSYSIE